MPHEEVPPKAFQHGVTDVSEQSQLSSCPPSKEGGLYALIEQLNARSSCSAANRPYLLAVNHNQQTVFVYRPNCGRWSCPACGQENARRWVHRIASAIDAWEQSGEHWHFGTLTARADRRGFDRSLSDWRVAWPKLLLRIKRERGAKAFRYVMVPEMHTDSTIHMHVIWNFGFGAKHRKRADGSEVWRSRWLADNCAETGLGYIHDCRPCKSALYAGFYAMKYMVKGLNVDDWPPNIRRVRTSQHWPKLPQGYSTVETDWITLPPSAGDAASIMPHIPFGYTVQSGDSTLNF